MNTKQDGSKSLVGDVKVKTEIKVEESMDYSQDHVMGESCDLTQKEAAFVLFSKFTKEVSTNYL
jgi:hypothetical protein